MGHLGNYSKNRNIEGNSNCGTGSLPEPDAGSFLKTGEVQKGEIIDEMQKEDIVSCSGNGVQFINLTGMFKVIYNGELAKNGADQVYAAIGYGNNQKWDDANNYPMKKTSYQTFELLGFRKRQGNVNIAFVDGAGNWDNNSGQNYIFYDSSGERGH